MWVCPVGQRVAKFSWASADVLQALHEAGFPTPTPIDCNRHCIVMSLATGFPLRTVTSIKHPAKVCADLMALIVRLARCGLIHCDFNEFNLMIGEDEDITIIDFPQMVSTSHRNAKMYFDRDVQCIVTYFERKHRFICEVRPRHAGVPLRGAAAHLTVNEPGWAMFRTHQRLPPSAITRRALM